MEILKGQLDYKKLVSDIFDASEKFKNDLILLGLDKLNLKDFYDYVKSLDYIDDGKKAEILSRPKYSLDPDFKVARDCDDKTLACAAFFRLKNQPFRLIVSGRKSRVHHIYPEIEIPGIGYIAFDTTYPDNKQIGERIFNEKKRQIFYDFA